MAMDAPTGRRPIRPGRHEAGRRMPHMNFADSRLGRLLAPTLIDRVERDHHQSDAAFRRRRIVVAVVVVLGATLLGISLRVQPDDPAFYPLTFGLAALWVVGGFASGPLHLGRATSRARLGRARRGPEARPSGRPPARGRRPRRSRGTSPTSGGERGRSSPRF